MTSVSGIGDAHFRTSPDLQVRPSGLDWSINRQLGLTFRRHIGKAAARKSQQNLIKEDLIMRTLKFFHWVIGLSVVLLLAACGGGGGGIPAPTEPTTPIGGEVPLPIATADTYAWIGNTPLTVPAAIGILSNDPVGSAIIASDTATTQGGTVSVAADGGFSYTPPAQTVAGAFTGADTFTYSVGDAAGTVTVTITIANAAWYADNSVAASGDGSFGSRFATLAEAITAAGAGDTIFAFAGNGGIISTDAAITLLAGQKLLGEGAAFTFEVQPGAPIEIVPAGTHPILSENGAAVPVVTLADNSAVAGFQLISGNADPESGAVLGIAVSGVSIRENLIPDAAGTAINLLNVSGNGTLSGNVVTNSGQDGIFITMDSLAPLSAQMTLSANTVDASGGLGGGIIVEIVANNQLRLVLSGNTVSNSVGEAGVFLLSGDTAQLKALVDGNILQDNQGALGVLDFDARSRDTSSLCLELTNNTSAAVAPGVGYLIENDGTALFQLFQANNVGPIEQTPPITLVPAGTCN
jgi:hypothetical protein